MLVCLYAANHNSLGIGGEISVMLLLSTQKIFVICAC